MPSRNSLFMRCHCGRRWYNLICDSISLRFNFHTRPRELSISARARAYARQIRHSRPVENGESINGISRRGIPVPEFYASETVDSIVLLRRFLNFQTGIGRIGRASIAALISATYKVYRCLFARDWNLYGAGRTKNRRLKDPRREKRKRCTSCTSLCHSIVNFGTFITLVESWSCFFFFFFFARATRRSEK